jgi:hypothetical protein
MESYNKKLHSLPQHTTYLNELTKIGKAHFGSKYRGTFPSDRIPQLKSNQCCIINLDTSNEPGSHWIAVARGKGLQCYAYDSFGRKASKLIPALSGVIDSQQDAEQALIEVNCGARCIAWLYVLYAKGVKVALTI